MKTLHKLCFLAVLSLSLPMVAKAEETAGKDSVSRWTFDFAGGINFAQAALVNWSAGGESSLSGNGKLDMKLVYLHQGHKWETNLKTEYGLVYNKTNGLNKTVDNLLLSTRYGYAIAQSDFYVTAFAGLETQYDLGFEKADDRKRWRDKEEGVNYISAIFAPGYLNTSVGVEYKYKTLVSVYFAPLSGRTTFVMDDYLSRKGAFGVDSGSHVLFQLGMTLNASLRWNFWKNMFLKSDAVFFTPYNKDFGKIVVDWNVGLEMAINNVFTAGIGFTLKYDDKVKSVRKDGTLGGPKVQFRELLTIGIGYTFQQKSKKQSVVL